MRLTIDDGYTLSGRTEADVADPVANRVLYSGLPVVTFGYRPALPEALAEWRFALSRANSGREQVDATAKLVSDHLVGWDVADATGREVRITPESVRRVPEPILDQIVKAVATWSAKEMESDAKNSPAG